MTGVRIIKDQLAQWGAVHARRDDLIESAYRAGLQAYVIAGLMTIDEHTVRRVLDRRGVPMRRGPAKL